MVTQFEFDKMADLFDDVNKHKKALENLFAAIAGSFKPLHWDKHILKALDEAAEVIGKERINQLWVEKEAELRK